MIRQRDTVSRRQFLNATAVTALGTQVRLGGAIDPTADGTRLARNLGQTALPSKAGFADVRALVFDTFGTVVDWRTSITQEVEQFAKRNSLKIDASKFADAWRAGYGPSMNRVRTGELPWTKLDDLHRLILNKLLIDFRAGALPEAEVDALNRAWHRLRTWPDSVGGLTRLKRKFTIAPLSNGNISLMTNLAKHSGLPWDCILGAELVRHYKPDREVYQSAADILDLKVSEVMMVAAHLGDLRAARNVGLRTAFVSRPLEFGPEGKPDLQADSSVDISARDFNELAGKLGA
jgi:2-haloacid dehalogenase